MAIPRRAKCVEAEGWAEGIREASSKMDFGSLELEMREGCFRKKEPHGQMLGGGKRKVHLFDEESSLARM